MKKYYFYLSVVITLIITISIVFYNIQRGKLNNYKRLNSYQERDTINSLALPLIKDEKKYIELQTKDWIEKRNNLGYCYGLLEKDKIVMTKWIEMFNISTPKIFYYNYHDKFTLKDLENVVLDNKDKRLLIKISHLQSNYGIIEIPSYNSQESLKYLKEIYKQCLNKFDSCFVCNHDKNDPPTIKEINKGQKTSYYKLYETIKPGVIIQDFFYSKKEGQKTLPIELKVLVYGDKILDIKTDFYLSVDFSKCQKVIEMARNISKILGASLIRVDVFVKEKDNPYIPYLNEISLSPNRGFKTKNIDKDMIKEYQDILSNYKPVDMEINNLIKECPLRDIPIKNYLTDAHWSIARKEKFRFGLLK